MKKALFALPCAVALAGCGTTASVPDTPEQAVFAAKSAYATALTAAVAYKRLPACAPARPMPCSEPALVAQLQRADNVAAASLDAAEAAARTPRVGGHRHGEGRPGSAGRPGPLTSLVASLGAAK